MNTEEKPEKTDRTDWHRLWGLMMLPLFEKLGCETVVEMDLSAKVQRLDMVIVTADPENIPYHRIEAYYYEGFENLNRHNLISFKSFREVFGMTALEELYGHFTNYRKIKNISESEKDTVNLYAVTHHFPRELFSRFEGKNLIDRAGERIYTLNLLTPVRFIVTRGTDHPVLGLFSDNTEQILRSRRRLENDRWLIREVSSYLGQLYRYYSLEGIPMPYTQEMFIKDHYPDWYSKIQTAKNEGKAEGRLIGEILMAQRILKLSLYSQEELERRNTEELRRVLSEIEGRLISRQ